MGKSKIKVMDIDWQQPAMYTMFGIVVAKEPPVLIVVLMLLVFLFLIKAVSLGRL